MTDNQRHSSDIFAGKRLEKFRVLAGLSRAELADMIGITHQQVRKYERAENRMSVSRINDLSKALKISPSYFFKENEVDVLIPTGDNMVITQLVRDYLKMSKKEQKALRQLAKDLSKFE